MSFGSKLRVKASGVGLVQDFEAMMGGVRRFIGWRHDPTLGEKYFDTVDKVHRHQGGFVTTDEVEEKPFRHEYVTAVREGHLVAADKATAELCGVPWDGDV